MKVWMMPALIQDSPKAILTQFILYEIIAHHLENNPHFSVVLSDYNIQGIL